MAGLPKQAVLIECRSIDDLEGAGGRARNDPVHDFAGGRAAASQNLRGTLPPLRPAFRRDKFFDFASAVSPDTAFRGPACQAQRRSSPCRDHSLFAPPPLAEILLQKFHSKRFYSGQRRMIS